MALSQAQKNKQAFDSMLANLRKRYTESEFIALYNRKYARIDPYAYTGGRSEKNMSLSSVKSPIISTQVSRSSFRKNQKTNAAGLTSFRCRYDFFNSGRHLTDAQRKWQHALRQYRHL